MLTRVSCYLPEYLFQKVFESSRKLRRLKAVFRIPVLVMGKGSYTRMMRRIIASNDHTSPRIHQQVNIVNGELIGLGTIALPDVYLPIVGQPIPNIEFLRNKDIVNIGKLYLLQKGSYLLED